MPLRKFQTFEGVLPAQLCAKELFKRQYLVKMHTKFIKILYTSLITPITHFYRRVSLSTRGVSWSF
jgi:hypothetical protein